MCDHTNSDDPIVRTVDSAPAPLPCTEWEGRLSIFERENGFDAAECSRIRSELRQHGVATGGGGAWATWELRLARP